MKNINPEKNNKKNIKTTILLFIVFFIISEIFITRPLRKKLENNQKSDAKVLNKSTQNKDQPTEEETNIKSKNIIIENDYIKLNINTKGLLLNNLILKKYKENINSDKKVQLLTQEENNEYFIDINWLSYNNVKLPTVNSIWTANKESLNNKDDTIIFSYDNKEGVVFKVIISLDEKYMINIKQVVENNTNNKIYLKPIWQIQKTEKSVNKNEIISFNGPLGVFNNKLEEIKSKKLKNDNIEFQQFNWAGITSKYWLAAIINEELTNGEINFLKKDNVLKVQYTTKNNLIVLENSFAGTKGKIFVGAKNLDILKEYQNTYNIKLLDRSIDFGFFYFLSKPLFLILNFFNTITHNFGVAIILLTVLIKLLLYPTVKKSFISMAKMKKVQPEMKRLQEIYKNDKITLQQELVKLYKKYELNPLSGIVPLFIQIPVFFSLYKVISISLNMRQAPFVGYIKDLSAADPTTIFNLFGLLPFEVKFTIGLLPCIMALTMYLQQKITDNMQQQNTDLTEQMKTVSNIVKYMPLIFLFMFSGFPSGLLLYWIFNNIITILQQLYINNKYLSKL